MVLPHSKLSSLNMSTSISSNWSSLCYFCLIILSTWSACWYLWPGMKVHLTKTGNLCFFWHAYNPPKNDQLSPDCTYFCWWYALCWYQWLWFFCLPMPRAKLLQFWLYFSFGASIPSAAALTTSTFGSSSAFMNFYSPFSWPCSPSPLSSQNTPV